MIPFHASHSKIQWYFGSVNSAAILVGRRQEAGGSKIAEGVRNQEEGDAESKVSEAPSVSELPTANSELPTESD